MKKAKSVEGRCGHSFQLTGNLYVFTGRKRKLSGATSQDKSSKKLEVPPGTRKRKRKGSEVKTEDGYASGSSGADDNAQEVRMTTLMTISSHHITTGTRNHLKQHTEV